MKRILYQFGKTVVAFVVAATVTSLMTASAQVSPEKGFHQGANAATELVDFPAAVSSPIGTWTGTTEGQIVKLRIKFLPDGTFKAQYTELFIPNNYGSSTQEFVSTFRGQWKQEEQRVVLTNTDGSVWQVTLGTIFNVLKLETERWKMELHPVRPVKLFYEQLGGSDGAASPKADPNDLIGTWTGEGQVRGTLLRMTVCIQSDGTFYYSIMHSKSNGTPPGTRGKTGTWKLGEREILFETENELISIPYDVHKGLGLRLDFRKMEGFLASLGKDGYGGMIFPVEETDDF